MQILSVELIFYHLVSKSWKCHFPSPFLCSQLVVKKPKPLSSEDPVVVAKTTELLEDYSSTEAIMVHRYIIIIHIHMRMQSTLLCCYIVLHVEVKPKDVYTVYIII